MNLKLSQAIYWTQSLNVHLHTWNTCTFTSWIHGNCLLSFFRSALKVRCFQTSQICIIPIVVHFTLFNVTIPLYDMRIPSSFSSYPPQNLFCLRQSIRKSVHKKDNFYLQNYDEKSSVLPLINFPH